MIVELALLTVISFPKGNEHDFVSTLARSTGQPTFAFFGKSEDFAPFSADTADASYFARVIKAKTGLQQAPGLDYSFSDGLIARNLINVKPIYNPQSNGMTVDAENFSVKDGKVTVTTGGSTMQMSVLMQRDWTTEIGWHWMFDRYFVSASLKELPERDFLKLVAKASGMRLDPAKKGVVFKLIPAEFKRRAAATISKYASAETIAKLEQQDKWRLEMTQFALGLANDSQIEGAFGSEDGEAAILMEGPIKQTLGSKLLKMANEASTLIRNGGDSRGITTLKPASEGNSGELIFRGSPASIAGFTQTVDWRRPVTLYLRSNFRVRIIGSSLPRDPNYSGPTSPVSVDF